MSRSPLIIGAIGIVGCFALSLTMREALEVGQSRQRDPLEMALESRFGATLAGPVRVERSSRAGRTQVLVELRVAGRSAAEHLLASAGPVVWDSLGVTGGAPAEVALRVVAVDGGAVWSADLSRPPRPQ